MATGPTRSTVLVAVAVAVGSAAAAAAGVTRGFDLSGKASVPRRREHRFVSSCDSGTGGKRVVDQSQTEKPNSA